MTLNEVPSAAGKDKEKSNLKEAPKKESPKRELVKRHATDDCTFDFAADLVSENVKLSADHCSAWYIRATSKHSYGVLFGDDPLKVFPEGAYFEVLLDKVFKGLEGGLTIGVTTKLPETLPSKESVKGFNMPGFKTAEEVPNSWTIGYNGRCTIVETPPLKRTLETSWNPEELVPGDRLGILVVPEGDLRLFVNDFPVAMHRSGVPAGVQLWPVVDLYGSAIAASLVSVIRAPQDDEGCADGFGDDGNLVFTSFSMRRRADNVLVKTKKRVTATRIDPSDEFGAVVFGDNPVPRFPCGWYFEVILDAATKDFEGGLAIGVTTVLPRPEDVHIMESGEDVKTSWSFGYAGGAFKSDGGMTRINWRVHEMQPGQKAGVFITNSFEMHLSVDQKLMATMPGKVAQSERFFAFVDVSGNAISVSVVPGAEPPESFQAPPASSRQAAPAGKRSTMRSAQSAPGSAHAASAKIPETSRPLDQSQPESRAPGSAHAASAKIPDTSRPLDQSQPESRGSARAASAKIPETSRPLEQSQPVSRCVQSPLLQSARPAVSPAIPTGNGMHDDLPDVEHYDDEQPDIQHYEDEQPATWIGALFGEGEPADVPVFFDPRSVGRNVIIENDGLTALHADPTGDELDGIAFCDGPLIDKPPNGDCYFEVVVEEVRCPPPEEPPFDDGLAIGVALSIPSEMPEVSADMTDSWSLGYDGSCKVPERAQLLPIQFNPVNLEVGQRVGILIQPDGHVWLIVDDFPVADLPTYAPSDLQLWPFVDLIGRVQAVSIAHGALPPPDEAFDHIPWLDGAAPE